MSPLVQARPPRSALFAFQRLVTSPAAFSSRATLSAEPRAAKRAKILRTSSASVSTTTSFLASTR